MFFNPFALIDATPFKPIQEGDFNFYLKSYQAYNPHKDYALPVHNMLGIMQYLIFDIKNTPVSQNPNPLINIIFQYKFPSSRSNHIALRASDERSNEQNDIRFKALNTIFDELEVYFKNNRDASGASNFKLLAGLYYEFFPQVDNTSSTSAPTYNENKMKMYYGSFSKYDSFHAWGSYYSTRFYFRENHMIPDYQEKINKVTSDLLSIIEGPKVDNHAVFIFTYLFFVPASEKTKATYHLLLTDKVLKDKNLMSQIRAAITPINDQDTFHTSARHIFLEKFLISLQSKTAKKDDVELLKIILEHPLLLGNQPFMTPQFESLYKKAQQFLADYAAADRKISILLTLKAVLQSELLALHIEKHRLYSISVSLNPTANQKALTLETLEKSSLEFLTQQVFEKQLDYEQATELTTILFHSTHQVGEENKSLYEVLAENSFGNAEKALPLANIEAALDRDLGALLNNSTPQNRQPLRH